MQNAFPPCRPFCTPRASISRPVLRAGEGERPEFSSAARIYDISPRLNRIVRSPIMRSFFPLFARICALLGALPQPRGDEKHPPSARTEANFNPYLAFTPRLSSYAAYLLRETLPYGAPLSLSLSRVIFPRDLSIRLPYPPSLSLTFPPLPLRCRCCR